MKPSFGTRECACLHFDWKILCSVPELSHTAVEMREVQYLACRNCGTITKDPFPPAGVLRDYYEKAWQYQSERSGLGSAVRFIAEGLRQPDGFGKFPLRAGPKMGEASFVGNGRVLEVGAKGDALARTLKAYGLAFTGSAALDAQPQEEGIQRAWIGEGVEPQENALTIAAHVMEHAVSPHDFLRDLLALTAEGGYVYIEVPSLQAGLFDVGLCDDINRNHLWHFSLAGLVRLASFLQATVTKIEHDTNLPGWPVLRLLLRKTAPAVSAEEAFSFVARDVASEYGKAELALLDRTPDTTALYGASHSYAQLRQIWAEGRRWKVYDLYKAGERWQGVTVRHPSQLASDGIREVFVTTRSFNSYVDIKEALYKSHPWLLVHTLYPNIRLACHEDEPAPRYVPA